MYERILGSNRASEDPGAEHVDPWALGAYNHRRISGRLLRLGALFLVLCVLELAVFGLYFTGHRIPPWDFLGSYNTVPFLWWKEGSFFSPIDWIPNSLAGYPAALIIQSSSWYLPVGVAAVFGDFTLHASAIVSALHVAFGYVGTYALVRSFRMPFSVCTLAAVAGFFAVGYFSNAQHVDIVRGYAWAPWLLLVLSPRWPWSKIWAVPVGALVLWQATTGIYPGMIFATAYVAIFWVVLYQWLERPSFRHFLGPLAVSGLAAALLCAPRLLPYILLSEDTAGALPDSSQFNLAMIGTLLFGYGDRGGFPNNISMNSFFLPATVIVLCWFADFRDRISKFALAIGIPAFALGMPFFPWFDLTQSWPGLSLSRFTMSDFKVFILLAVVLLGCSGMYRLFFQPAMKSRAFWGRFCGALTLVLVLLVLGATGPFTFLDWVPGFCILVVVLVFVSICRSGWMPKRAYAVPVVLVTLTMLSGTVWAFTTRLPWTVPRITAELETYGSTVDELLSMRSANRPETRRPARIPLSDGYDAKMVFSGIWNGAYYQGKDALGGYVNVKGSETVNRLTAGLTHPQSGPLLAKFLAAPGLILFGDATPEKMKQCAESAACGGAVAIPAGYSIGEFDYKVSAPAPTVAVLNEAFYAGWQAEACNSGDCRALAPTRSSDGLIQLSLPKGDYDLRLQYRAPGRTVGWAVFSLGIVLMAVGMVVSKRSVRKAAAE